MDKEDMVQGSCVAQQIKDPALSLQQLGHCNFHMLQVQQKKKKVWFIYTAEYYLVIKKNKIIPFGATLLQLETLILNEVSQKDKDKYHMISLICRS